MQNKPFIDYKKSNFLLKYGLLLGGMLVCAYFFLKMNWLAAIGWGILLLAMGQALLFYRCPHCGERLSIRNITPTYCPACGRNIKIEDETKTQ